MKSSVLLQPVISEKSYVMANAMNKYVFLVQKISSKIEIAKEVEKMYKVKVEDVNIVTRPGKLKRNWRTRNLVRRTDDKKAIVTLKKGDKIEEFLNI